MGEDSSKGEELGAPLQSAVDRNWQTLEAGAGSPAAQSWLKPKLESPEGTVQVYEQMERIVSGPGFLAKLTAAFSMTKTASQQSVPNHGRQVLEPEFWDETEKESASQVDGAPDMQGYEKISSEEARTPSEPIDSYVVVDREDVLEAIGSFVASYLAELPNAQNMQPAELQQAIKRAFKELQQSRMRRLWGWGRAIYRTIAFSYGAFSVYENPWLVRALLAALWTASKIMFGLLPL